MQSSAVATAGAHQHRANRMHLKNTKFLSILKTLSTQTPAEATCTSFTTNNLATAQAQQLMRPAFRVISALASFVHITVH